MSAKGRSRVGDGPVFRPVLLTLVMLGAALLIVGPLAIIFVEAFKAGLGVYLSNLAAPDTVHAIGLTVLTALVAVPVNVAFGIAAAWAIAKFEFPGKGLLTALVELPFSISPIVAGVAYLFVYGAQGWFGPTLDALGIKVMFAYPAIVLASLFVTAPFVAREILPVMQQQGSDEEEAALSLGASGWRTLWSVTLPNVRWALLYGAVLTNARVMGEFGAVSVVSGSIRGVTNTLPLQIELLYQDYNAAGAFAAATVLAGIALLTIVAKLIVERMDPDRTG
ncbi:sulfate transport system permease protein [Methylopila capsulata]|uniref:ABC transporter permease n=1 Tax=Methylopila capsulata TaxID=61654 RepID=A0A9W6MTF4_9HYPH|nr:sulfate ABC transporter permease subunit CysW [Methylopila capsulata]MBM7852847.1 sulfate transport system permease protein [Methylopila capsulata]GLK57056.1 ABC transporter permease [Methylopila capsulata]